MLWIFKYFLENGPLNSKNEFSNKKHGVSDSLMNRYLVASNAVPT